jgi:hypothetical protein
VTGITKAKFDEVKKTGTGTVRGEVNNDGAALAGRAVLSRLGSTHQKSALSPILSFSGEVASEVSAHATFPQERRAGDE